MENIMENSELENVTIAPKGTNYLSDIMSTLPENCLFDKGRVGCGGTTIALVDANDWVIACPFVSLIKNKVAQYPSGEIFGVYKGIRDYQIKKYVNNCTGNKKIMCTYDSLPRVMSALGDKVKDYRLLVDELHLLFMQYSFRREAMINVLNNYKSFKTYTFMTATPIDKSFMLKQLREVPTTSVDWEEKFVVTVKAVKCIDAMASTTALVRDFLNGDIEGNAYFFVNSVKFIKSILEYIPELNSDNCRVIYSTNNESKEKPRIANGSTTDKAKKINFLTSTVFEGSDIYDEEGKTYVISDASAEHTLLDISTSFTQICGRIRNTKYKSEVYHLYTYTRYSSFLTYKEFEKDVDEQIVKANRLIDTLSSLDEYGRKCIRTENDVLYVEKNNETYEFSFDENMLMIDKHNFKLTREDYSIRVSPTERYKGYNVEACISVNKLEEKIKNDVKVLKGFKECVEYIRDYRDIDDYSKNIESEILDRYPFIFEAIDKVGFDKMEEFGYHLGNIKRAMLAASDIKECYKVYKSLKINSKFKSGEFLTNADIKTYIQDTYNRLGIKKTAKASDIKEYFDVKRAVKDSKEGLVIIKEKVGYSNANVAKK